MTSEAKTRHVIFSVIHHFVRHDEQTDETNWEKVIDETNCDLLENLGSVLFNDSYLSETVKRYSACIEPRDYYLTVREYFAKKPELLKLMQIDLDNIEGLMDRRSPVVLCHPECKRKQTLLIAHFNNLGISIRDDGKDLEFVIWLKKPIIWKCTKP